MHYTILINNITAKHLQKAAADNISFVISYNSKFALSPLAVSDALQVISIELSVNTNPFFYYQ